MKKKKVSLAKFTNEGRQRNGKKKIKCKFNSRKSKVAKIKEVSNGCWWVEVYLSDRCGLVKTEGVKWIGR